MKLPHVLSCGVYRAAEKSCYRVFAKWIAFVVSGLRYRRSFFPDGQEIKWDTLTPHLGLWYPEFVSDFEYGGDRENYVLIFESEDYEYDVELHRLYLRSGDRREYLNFSHPVAAEDVPAMRDLFLRISRLAKSGLASDNLRADFLASGLFAYFLDEETSPDSPAIILKKRIDDDRGYRISLNDHAKAIGMNSDYLRREFIAQFGITPGEYREKQRRNDLLAKFTYTNSSFKEIAAELGMKHVQHLNLLTQKYFRCTPSELAAKYRHPVPYVTPDDLKNDQE